MKDFGLSRNVAVVPKQTALLLIDVQNYTMEGGGEYKGLDAETIERKYGYFFREMRGRAIPNMQKLLAACRKIGGCPSGEARLTPGFGLQARWIIHTVGPVWNGGRDDEARLLASCYKNSLRLASQHGIGSIAFPAISTGAFGYPSQAAADIAIWTVRDFKSSGGQSIDVVFCCYSADDLALYHAILSDPRRSRG